MSYRERGNVDYATAAKRGFVFGMALFALGTVGEVIGATYVAMPAIVDRLFFGMEVTGVALGLLVPVVFGAVLPLTE